MNLPENKKLKKVIYEYGDESYFIANKDLEIYLDNLKSSSIMHFVHGATFKKINWKKNKKEKMKK